MDHHAITADDLREGHEIAVKFNRDGEPTKFRQVTEVGECAGQWRTHRHVLLDGSTIPACYDGRHPVTVKGRAPLPEHARAALTALAGR